MNDHALLQLTINGIILCATLCKYYADRKKKSSYETYARVSKQGPKNNPAGVSSIRPDPSASLVGMYRDSVQKTSCS